MPLLSKFRKLITQPLRNGFSMVEMLIYIFILVLLLSIIMNIVVSTIRSGRVLKALRSVEDSAVLSLERIVRETRQADSIDPSSSVLNYSPGRLVLEGEDEFGNPRTVEFYVFSDKLFIRENGVDLGPLTQADARVSSLIFRTFSAPNAGGIKTEMTIESGTNTHFRTDNFYSSALLR